MTTNLKNLKEKAPDLIENGFVKSQYKLYCICCNNVINKGDQITQLVEDGGLVLRPKSYKYGFYTTYTGARWIHKYCTLDTYWTRYAAVKYADDLDKIFEESI